MKILFLKYSFNDQKSKSTWEGLKLDWDHGFLHMMEVDSKVDVDKLRKLNGVDGYNGVLIKRCIQLINMDWSVEITHVHRRRIKLQVGWLGGH